MARGSLVPVITIAGETIGYTYEMAPGEELSGGANQYVPGSAEIARAAWDNGGQIGIYAVLKEIPANANAGARPISNAEMAEYARLCGTPVPDDVYGNPNDKYYQPQSGDQTPKRAYEQQQQIIKDQAAAQDAAAAAAAAEAVIVFPAQQTETDTGLTALSDVISPYIVPVIAGLIVTAIVMLLAGSSRTGRTGKRTTHG